MNIKYVCEFKSSVQNENKILFTSVNQLQKKKKIVVGSLANKKK